MFIIFRVNQSLYPLHSIAFLRKPSLILLLVLGISLNSAAQYNLDKLDLDQDVSTWFDTQFGLDQGQLVAGSYQATFMSINSHPFFEEKVWIKGELNYRGQTFQNVQMIYNIFDDYLVIKHPKNMNLASQPIKLEYAQIGWFDLNNHHFVNFKTLSGNSGHYDLLFQGSELQLVSKRIKKEYIERSNDPVGYKQDDRYYLIYQNQLYPVRNKSGYIKVFPNLKKQIKSYVKENGLLVSTKNEFAMKQLAEFCNQAADKQ